MEDEKVKNGDEEKRDKPYELMWFYDEAWMSEECRSIRKKMEAIEGEYLELRKELRDIEEMLMKGDDEYLKAKVNYIKRRIKELEKKFPWLLSDVPLEALLWGVPHG